MAACVGTYVSWKEMYCTEKKTHFIVIAYQMANNVQNIINATARGIQYVETYGAVRTHIRVYY